MFEQLKCNKNQMTDFCHFGLKSKLGVSPQIDQFLVYFSWEGGYEGGGTI